MERLFNYRYGQWWLLDKRMAGICCIVEYRAGQYFDSYIDDFGFYLITAHSYPLLFVILNVASTKCVIS